MAELREEVARAIAKALTGGFPSGPKSIDHAAADAAIAICMEQAAKVADYAVERAERDWRLPDKQDAVSQVGAEIAEVIRSYAAIRALAPERPS